ncbi:MAG: extracellular solute-binding protein, partial [Treponema sp.]|nr:extracellular solute-binding protein [Treponema sp.]
SDIAQAASQATGKKLVIWTNMTAEAQTKVLLKQFAEVSKEMDIETEMVTVAFADLYTKLAAAVQSGTAPDVIQTTDSGAAYMYGQNMITPLNDVIDAIGRDDFLPSFLSEVTVGGKNWGVPDWANHNSIWYRQDLFSQYNLSIPKTWAELLTTAKALNIDTNSDGRTDIYGMAVPMASVQVAMQTYYEFLTASGIYIYDPETGEYFFGKDKEKAAKVLDYMIELYKAASPPASTDWSWNDYRNALVQGNVAMTQDFGGAIGIAIQNNPDIVKNLGSFEVPGPDGEAAAHFGGGYYFMAGNQGGDEKIALAKQFIEKLYTPERAAERALSRPLFAFPSIVSAFEIYKKDSSVADFQEEVNGIWNAMQTEKWYRQGMESGLNELSGQIEATTYFGEAIQSVALGQWTSSQAVDYIDQNLREQIETISKK